ncbi:hypothetical protein ACFL0T_08085, partial [Candidatus Omnitrophota bacterium]
SNNRELLSVTPDILVNRFDQRLIKNEFFTKYHLRDRYYPGNIDYLKKRMDKHYDKAKINLDYHPICFHYNLTLWGLQFHPGLVKFFKLLAELNIFIPLLAILFFFVLSLIVIKLRAKHILYTVPVSIAVSGALCIALEIIIILSFQITYGYVYSKVGFLIALFMLGIALGGFIVNRSLERIDNHKRWLSLTVLFLSSYTLALPSTIKMISMLDKDIIQFIFYLMALLAGCMTGSQFPLALSILKKEERLTGTVSIIWGADLLGAAAGTLICSLVTIPILGIYQTALLGSLLGALTFVLLTLSHQIPQR